MSHRLIVLPDDTAKPIIDAIAGAKKALNIRMFLFTDPTLIDAVIGAHKRGVKVRVMLNPARRSGESENEEARKLLTDAGIEVHDSNPAFALTHQKSMVIDDETGFVESLNWEPKDLTQTRDYAIVTTHGHEVAEMVACFDADWEHKKFKPQSNSALIWCPDNGRQRLAEFIDATRHTLWLQNERYQDQVIIERLVRAVTRGVKVHILAKPPHSLKPDKLIEGVGGLRILQDVGAKVHTLKHLKLHAKMLCADSKRAIVGSINIAPGSFDARRELAIETDDPAAVKRLEATAEHDWSKSHLLDLSDAALLADLKKRDGLDPGKLVLYEDSEHWGYHHDGHHGKKTARRETPGRVIPRSSGAAPRSEALVAPSLALVLLALPVLAWGADPDLGAVGAAGASPSSLASASAPADAFTWHFDWRGWDGLQVGLSQRTSVSESVTALPVVQLDRLAIDSTISGKLEFDAAAYDTTGSLTGFDNGIELRRARIKVKGDSVLLVPFLYRLDIGYVPSVFTVTQAYVEFQNIDVVGSLRVGVFQPPMGLDFITGSWDIAFMEPAAPLQALLPRTQPGVQLARAFAQGRATWALGLFGDASGQAEYGSASQNLGNLIGRASWLALDEIDSGPAQRRRLWHLGLSTSLQYAAEGKLQFRSRPESYIAPYAIDSGTITASSAATIGAEIAWVDGAFSVQAEFVHAAVEQTGGAGRLNFGGAYALASWCLTGESRPYDRQTGSFGRLVPQRDFAWGEQGGWGAFELAARYSYTDLSDRNVQGGRMGLLMGGLNWYPQPHIRWMFELGAGKVRGGPSNGNMLIAQTRVGLDF